MFGRDRCGWCKEQFRQDEKVVELDHQNFHANIIYYGVPVGCEESYREYCRAIKSATPTLPQPVGHA